MPGQWTNRQTELIAGWITEHPELIPLFRTSIDDGDNAKLREHVVDYFFPVKISRDAYSELIHMAMDAADWDQLRLVILPDTNGTHT